MSREDCCRVLGEPHTSTVEYTRQTLVRWVQPHDVAISFTTNRENHACEITGDTLTDYSGGIVVWGSASEDDVKAILKSARIKKQYRPKGSGIISIGWTHVGTSYTCTDSNGTYCVSFHEGRLVNIRGWR